MRRKQALAAVALYELVFAVFTLSLARPAFASRHLPLQDLPQHMAAIRVLGRYLFDGTLQSYFELTLSRTQYLLVYALGALLSPVFGVEYATRILCAVTVVGLPYALRYALRRTGGDERWAVLAWPFAWNPQMMLGFLNFLLGIPLALWAVGLFAQAEERTQRKRQLGLAALSLGAFYSHLVPYGLLGLGVLLQLELPKVSRLAELPRALREWLPRVTRELLFLVPSLLAVLLWIVRSPARDASVRAGGVGQELVLTWPEPAALPGEFRDTILQAAGNRDEWALLGWGLALLFVLGLARFSAAREEDTEPSLEDSAPLRPAPAVSAANRRVALLPALCAALYVSTPASYGWIWPIHTRFAVSAVLLLPLALPRVRARWVPLAVVLALGLLSRSLCAELTSNFQRWDEQELGDLDEALAHAQPGRRLVALVPASGSNAVPGNVPALHAAAYYQVRGGAVATFSFADFPQSPFRYREGGPRPARLRPRWEWQTSLREADPNLDYYDYVLVRRGALDEAAQHPERYERAFEGSEWSLYARRR